MVEVRKSRAAGERWVRFVGRHSRRWLAAFWLLMAMVCFVIDSDTKVTILGVPAATLFLLVVAGVTWERWHFYRLVQRQDAELATLRGQSTDIAETPRSAPESSADPSAPAGS